VSVVPDQGPLLAVRGLDVSFHARAGVVHAVKHVSFDVQPGRTLCLLGESGSGKSLTLKSVIRLLPPQGVRVAGSICFAGTEILTLASRELARLRGKQIAMVFQEPMSALDPVSTVGNTICQAVRQHTSCSHRAARLRAIELFDMVRIPSAARRLDAYPYELSGGLRQRAMIALALSCRPALLLADEPTTALDATVQIQVLVLLRQLQAELNMGMVFVTHDLGAAAEVADDVAVMHRGQIVESADAVRVLTQPEHPYTQALLKSSVRHQRRGEELQVPLDVA
jgi:peptide/nickel transport system ATP-binding protein